MILDESPKVQHKSLKKLTVWPNHFTGKNNNINLKIIWSQDKVTHLILRKKNPILQIMKHFQTFLL